MMKHVTVVGSGASGVHFAQSLLEKNYRVTMVDVGRPRPVPEEPDSNLVQLKARLKDPVQYFLGPHFESVIYPDAEGEYYGFPQSKEYVFANVSSFQHASSGFHPLFSFAQGGLAEAWTGGVYPLNERDLKGFPFSYEEIQNFYDEVAARIGISGCKDDLQRFYPVHRNLMEPLRLDDHSQRILKDYERKKEYLNQKLKCFIGRARVATLSRDYNGRKACRYSGRCLWGCPTESLYTPSITLRQCLAHPNFEYISHSFVKYFRYRSGKVESLVLEQIPDRTTNEIPVDHLALAAGTLSSSRIFLESIWKGEGEIVALKGLMDNRQILIPFINLKMIGAQYNSEAYQYHQLALGIECKEPEQYLHGLITTLKTALVQPIIRNIPLDLRSAISVFRNVRAGLGLINLNFPDDRRQENYLTLEAGPNPVGAKLIVHYSPAPEEEAILKKRINTVKKILSSLGCFVAPGTVHIRPMGSSVHYAGTLPMSRQKIQFGTNEFCRSHDFQNLHVVDGSTFPSLPSKNLTFALMANAMRVAHHEF